MNILAAMFVSVLCTVQIRSAYSFEVQTHVVLSQQALLSSTLDNFLKNGLFFLDGISARVVGREIRDVIAEGSRNEDDSLRFFNHFHNPLRTWDQAGLLNSTLGKSSIVWGQTPSQEFAWQNARDEYFLALTATSQAERDQHFSKTFSAIGHLIHLVQDAAQPAHTRDDAHPIMSGFEGYVADVRSAAANGTVNAQNLFNSWISRSDGFDQQILLNPTQNRSAPIPVSRIIDTADPEQPAAVPSDGINQGLAEYSNANFLSEDTIFKDFVFPRVESLGAPIGGVDPATNRERRYFPKVADGDTGYYLVAEGVWWETLRSLITGDQGYIMDSQVRNDYASKLLPRAIGYSAGLIDYFFRGDIGIAGYDYNQERSDEGTLTAWALGFTVQNDSSETMIGSFDVLEFDGQQQSQSIIARWDGITLAPGEVANLCLSSFNDTAGVCTSFASIEYQSRPPLNICAGPQFDPQNRFTVVFQGNFGEEKNGGAVVGKLFEICFGTE